MLTVVPPRTGPSEQEIALLRIVTWYASWWPGWARFLIGACAVFHLWMAVTLAFAPTRQIVNTGTAPVFALAPPLVWAVGFAVVGVGAAMLFFRVTPVRLALLWSLLLPLFLSWFSSFVLAVIDGRGSALSIIVWPTLYGPFIVAAVRCALRKR